MARQSLTLTVELRITDNEARSALEAVQVKMGLGDRVTDLVREELWEIEVEAADSDAALEVLGGLVKTTNLFANPNKHRYTLAAGEGARAVGEGARATGGASGQGARATGGASGQGAAGAPGEAATGANGHDLAPDEVAILVTDREGTAGASVLSAIKRIGVDDVVGVRKWTRWRVRLSAPAESGDPELLSLITRIGVATGRRDGLLSNPHSQISRAVLPWGEEKVLAA